MESTNKQRTPLNREKKHEFTTVDAVVLLLLLIMVIGSIVGWVYQALEEDDMEIAPSWVVSFRVTETHRVVTDGLATGDALYMLEDGCFLGYLREGFSVQDKTDGNLPSRVTGMGSMICVGNVEGRSLDFGCDRFLTPGDTVMIRTEREFLTVEILEIVSAVE